MTVSPDLTYFMHLLLSVFILGCIHLLVPGLIQYSIFLSQGSEAMYCSRCHGACCCSHCSAPSQHIQDTEESINRHRVLKQCTAADVMVHAAAHTAEPPHNTFRILRSHDIVTCSQQTVIALMA
jgi:hypothetical protein